MSARPRGKKRRVRKPFQFGLASLMLLMTFVAVAVWLGPAYWLHIGSVFGQILYCLLILSVVGGLLAVPYLAVVGAAKVGEVARDLVCAIQDRQEQSKDEANDSDDV
jgi:hypothetical protein